MFSFLKNPWYRVGTAVLLCALAVIFNYDLFGFKTMLLSFVDLRVVGTVAAMAAAPVVAPFPVDPELTSVAVAYRNEELIADEVLPRIPVGKQSGKYKKFKKEDGFTIPDTQVGRTSQPNRVEFGYTEDAFACDAHGLDEPVPKDDIDNAPSGYDPLARAAMSVTDLILLDREKRAANLVFNVDSYAAANREALAGNGMFSDFTNSDPLTKLLTVMDGMIMRPNKVILGNTVWTTLRRHPKLVSAALGNEGTQGLVKREQLAELLEVKKVVVGKGWHNTAKKGNTPTMTRLWGNYIALIYTDDLASINGDRVTFGFTAQWKDRIAGQKPDSSIGLEGGILVRCGEYVKELITANDLGFLLSNVV